MQWSASGSPTAGHLESGGDSYTRTREKFRQQLREGKLDERQVEIDVREKSFPAFEIISNQGVEEMDINVKDMLPNLFEGRRSLRLPDPGRRAAPH